MTAQVITFPQRAAAASPGQQWPADPDEYLIEVGRMVARHGQDISDDEARKQGRSFLGALAAEKVIVSGMTVEERLKRLTDTIEQVFSMPAAQSIALLNGLAS